VSYLPLYHLMALAAGNDIVGVTSQTNKVTGEIKLLPVTLVNGVETTVTGTAPNPNVIALVALVFIQVVFVCMVYGPIAAYLVEAFPAAVRYTSMSLPYHIGNGIFGGLLPVIGLTICAATGSIYAGLGYPIVIAVLTAIIGWRLLPETRHVRIWDEVELAGAGGPSTTASSPAIDLRDDTIARLRARVGTDVDEGAASLERRLSRTKPPARRT